MAGTEAPLSETEKSMFEAVDKNDADKLRVLLGKEQKVNIVDEHLMTPLQHACYKGNKDTVQILLDRGADVNLCQHKHGYTALHFAGLAGNADVCSLLLLSGAKVNAVNTVGRTSAQMAAFVGNHSCVATINSFIPQKDIDYYTALQGLQTEPALPQFISDSFHKFAMGINVHPVKVALSLSRYSGLAEHLDQVKTVLASMCEREMKRGAETNEVMAFKFHYLGYVAQELAKCRSRNLSAGKDADFIESFAKRMLKCDKEGNLESMDGFLRECVREFPFRECTIFRQMVASLASKDAPSALAIVNATINGQRGFVDNVTCCETCGEEKPSKKCAKCKAVQYCDRECQRLHWFMHKKNCAQLAQSPQLSAAATKQVPDAGALSAQVQNILLNK